MIKHIERKAVKLKLFFIVNSTRQSYFLSSFLDVLHLFSYFPDLMNQENKEESYHNKHYQRSDHVDCYQWTRELTDPKSRKSCYSWQDGHEQSVPKRSNYRFCSSDFLTIAEDWSCFNKQSNSPENYSYEEFSWNIEHHTTTKVILCELRKSICVWRRWNS